MAYSKKANKNAPEETPEITKPYDLVVVDADTPVFRASKFIQEDYIEVTHIKSGGVKEYRNKTEFYGHWKKKEGGDLAKMNEKRVANGKPILSVDDFEIAEHVRLIAEIDDHVAEGLKSFDMFIGGLKKQNLADDYKLLIGGEGNYRYDIAQTLKYKGDRPEKPILFLEIREAIIEKYGKYIQIVDGKEVDDEMAIWGYNNECYEEELGTQPYLLAYIDKDLDSIVSHSINYDKFEEGIRRPTALDCMRCYCVQLMIGDLAVDNIPSLPNLVEELREEYGVRKGKGLGKATALSYLNTADNIPELLKRVVRAYVAFYGVSEYEFTNYKGEVSTRTWMDELQERAILVYMNPLGNPLDYHIRDTLEEYEVNYKAIEKEYAIED